MDTNIDYMKEQGSTFVYPLVGWPSVPEKSGAKDNMIGGMKRGNGD
ncbi:MAG TPA: hypothetical protein PKA53_03885 [Sphingobacterium sp.]|nr:hypothetical protein [Sphingobacterium sp.]